MADPRAAKAVVGVTTPTTARSRAIHFRSLWPLRRQRLLELLFLLPAVAFLLVFFAYPIAGNVVMAFQHYTSPTFFTGHAPWAGLANYRAVLRSNVFSEAARNTLLFTAGSIAGQFTIGLGLALYFQRKFPLSGLLRSLFLLPWLIPLPAATTVLRWILHPGNGVLN